MPPLRRADGDRASHPGAADALLLVIELSPSPTRPIDRSIKLPLYAKMGVPEAWIVDLSA